MVGAGGSASPSFLLTLYQVAAVWPSFDHHDFSAIALAFIWIL